VANKDGHRRFGSIRKRASGRFQVRYLGPDGRMRSAPNTFGRKSEAERYLSLVESQMMRGEWIDSERGKIKLKDYAEAWIIERPRLRPRTIELYSLLLRLHIAPYLGDVELGRLTTPMIRTWRAELAKKSSDVMAAKAYRLLRAVLNTASREDELIRVNPCRVPGADKEQSAERPVLTIPQVLALAEAVPDRYRALIALSTFACLRWGEVIALQRADIDLKARTVSITKAYSELTGSEMVVGPTKSRAGVRTVTFPALVLPYLRSHLEKYTDAGDEALVFTGARSGPLRRSNFRTATKWGETCQTLGFPGLHFHDLRHTGNTLAAQTGTSLRDLMTRMGHDSPRAALIYQHASSGADRAIAEALDLLIEAAGKLSSDTQREDDEGDDGTAGSLVPAP
jgi:integrase